VYDFNVADVVAVVRVMQAVLLAARIRAADPISPGSIGSPLFISTDALLALQALGYQVCPFSENIQLFGGV
jgi:hypothetical protein